MIQRKQSLYLLSLLIISVSLILIPSAKVDNAGQSTNIYLWPLSSDTISASLAQVLSVGLNLLSLLISLVCIFLYKRRVLQLKVSYVLMIIWLFITMILSFASLVESKEGLVISNTNFGTLLGIFGMLGAYMAARLIKKDIELLKSADRIR